MSPNVKRKKIDSDDEEDMPLMVRKKPKKTSPKTKKKKRKYEDDEESDEPEEVCATRCYAILCYVFLSLGNRNCERTANCRLYQKVFLLSAH